MASRLTSLSTQRIREYEEERKAEMARKKILNAQRRREQAAARSARSKDQGETWVPSWLSSRADAGEETVTEKIEKTRTVHSDNTRHPVLTEVLESGEDVMDDGYCYTAMARDVEGLTQLKQLGPSPTTEKILNCPLDWFTYPLVGNVTPMTTGEVFIHCEPGTWGQPLDRFMTNAAEESLYWPEGSLGAELMQGHLGRTLQSVGVDGTSACADVVALSSLPSSLPSDVLIVCGVEADVALLKRKYPACRVMGPRGDYKAKDIFYYPNGVADVDGWLDRRVSGGASRAVVYVTQDQKVRDNMEQRSNWLRCHFDPGTRLIDVKTGPEGAVDLESRKPSGFVDDDDYAFLCDLAEDKERVREWFPGAGHRIYTKQEVHGKTFADVYYVSRSALRQSCPCPQLAYLDMSQHIGTGATHATRGFYLVDTPRYGSLVNSVFM